MTSRIWHRASFRCGCVHVRATAALTEPLAHSPDMNGLCLLCVRPWVRRLALRLSLVVIPTHERSRPAVGALMRAHSTGQTELRAAITSSAKRLVALGHKNGFDPLWRACSRKKVYQLTPLFHPSSERLRSTVAGLMFAQM
jgi:hypothetical protein